MKELLAKKKKKKPTQNTTSAPKEDEEPATNQNVVQDSQGDTQDAESPQLKFNTAATKQNKDDDDESDDEANYTAKTNTKIVESQPDSSKNKNVIEVPDYMMKPDETKDADDKPIKRRNANDIQFGGGRPQFGNRRQARGILGGDDFQSLDAIDDEGKQNQNSKNKKNNFDERESNFVNLGSTPVQKNVKKFEEEKEKEKPKGPPKFFNANKGKNVGANNTPSTGQNIMYDFGVKYKSDNPEGGKKPLDKKEDGQNTTEVRKDKRRINQDKGRFDEKPQGLDNDSDDGFEIVRNPNQKRRQQRQFNRAQDLDSGLQRREDDGPRTQQKGGEQQAPLKKGGAFGNIGGDSD